MESENFITIINSTAVLITAIGALLAGIGAILKAVPISVWRSLRLRMNRRSSNTTKTEDKPMKTFKKGLIIMGVFLVLSAVGIFTLRTVFAQEVPQNQELTTAAWKHYEAAEYSKAISNASECIEMFSGQAEIEQKELIENKIPIPTPTPKTEEAKQEIFARGLLNDVATCYFITGQAYEKLGNETAAIEAYREAEKFKHAMAWDPKGWFWNVSRAAAGRIRYLEKND